jgi:hypothetical protein
MRAVYLRSLIVFIFITSLVFTTTAQDKDQRSVLTQLSDELNKEHQLKREEVLLRARRLGIPVRQITKEGITIELQGFENGQPVYYITHNRAGANTIKTNELWPGGATGLDLTGQGQKLGMWDAGATRLSHQELTGRVTQADDATILHDHATHVATTMIGAGVVSDARGMSYQATLDAYDWNNDLSEMAAAAANGLKVSQHSYGFLTGWHYSNDEWFWYGNPTISETTDYRFGFYDQNTQQWDVVANNAPNYLIVKSAGNDRGSGPAPGTQHKVWVSGAWELSTTVREIDGATAGYDCIPTNGNAKNIMTVGAVTATGEMSSFSSWGPTDDGRIKPDIVAKGVSVYSGLASADDAYASWNGTSMSGPMVSGSVGLLLQHRQNLKGVDNPMLSSSMKALIIHTADELGGNPGPDYSNGWGMMNTRKAADLMSKDAMDGFNFNIREYTLNNGQTIEFTVKASGDEPLITTIAWNDPAGTPPAYSLNPTTSMLVNDLDVRIQGNSTTYQPWILDPAIPANAATTGDNFRDNVEQVHIANPVAGEIYTITINHKNALASASQMVSVIVSGITSDNVINPVAFSATTMGMQNIKLDWTKNNQNNDVLVLTSSNSTFGTPSNGTSYTVGSDITGGGKVLYKGSAVEYSHENLTPGQTYYYRIFSFDSENEYSSGKAANATTLATDVSIGNESLLGRLPFNFNWDYSLTQSIYLNDDIGRSEGTIEAIEYAYNFDAPLTNKPIKIWMGETTSTNLSAGWIDPASLQLVFDGNLDFLAGGHTIKINLNNTFEYNGGNLVIYNYKSDDSWTNGKFFLSTAIASSGRSMYIWQDDIAYDPNTPPAGSLLDYFPNTTLFFKQVVPTFTITMEVNPVSSGTTNGAGTYEQGETANLTATPAYGYSFVNWTEGGTEVSTQAAYSFEVTADRTLTAQFAINTYTLTYTAGTNGSLTGTLSQTVNHGASGTAITAVPATNYHFVQWSDGSTANPRTDSNVTGNISVTAQFAINTYTLTYTAGANGSLTGTLSQTVDHGASGTAVTAVPATNYHFVQWSDGSTANPRTDENVTGNISVTAQFAINTYTLTYTAGANGSLTGTLSQTVNHGASGTSVTAVPATNYHFVQWSDGSTANPRTDSNVTGNISVTAQFAINTYTLTYTAGANGSLTGTLSQTVDHGASGTAVTAVPATNYHFVQWSDGSTANPRTDSNVTGNISVTAQFAINTYTLTYTAGTNGSLTGTLSQTVNHGASGTAITAVPATNYHFVQWSDGSTANPRTDSNVTGNISVTAQFAINTYTLTYTAGTNGSLTGTLSQTVNHGASGTAVTAIPATNYHFVQWSDGSTANPRTDSNVTGNISVTAQFAINTYTLTYTAGTNGSLTGTLSQTVNHGASGTSVTAVPETNYHFVQWSDGSTANPRTDSNVTGNISVTAQFAINTYTLTYTAGANGSLTGTLSQTVNHGASGTSVTAVPATNYHFVQWSDGSTANPRTDSNVTGNISLTAQFAINTYTLTYTAGANGSLTGTLSQTVNHGASGTAVTAVPATNYHFVQWSDGSTANPRTDSNVTGNISVTAQFAINTYTLTYTAGTNGSLTGTLSQTVNHGASGTAITAVPATNYHFVQWSDGSTTNPRTDSNVTDNISVTAQFAINTYTLTYTAGANGSLTGTLSQTVNHGASGTSVTAVPETNYHFVQWSDGSNANPRTDSNVTGNISVTAQFAINTYTLTYTAGANGSLTGTLSQTVNHGASGTSVTAVPATNYHFVQWSDGSTANPRTDSNVTGNISVTAQFALTASSYTLTYQAGTNGSLSGDLTQTVNHGASGTAVTAVPATNYHFVQWSDGSTVNPRTDSNVTGNISVTAQFAINTYTLTYTAGANGSLTGTLSQTVNHGASGTSVTAVPETNYHFVQWSDGSTANPRTDSNVTGNISVTAQFAINTYTLTYTAGTNGSLTGTLSQTVNHGASGTAITAVPATNYHFVQWSDGSTTNPRTDSNVTDNISVTAQFAINTYTLTYTAGANGSLTGTLSQTVNHGASGTSVTAVPETNYHFVQWSDGSNANPRTDSNVTGNISVTAQFAINTYTLTYTAGTNGSLTGTLSQTVNHGASGTAITAVPATNYHFVQWSDGSTANPRTDSNVTGNISVTAQFAINTYTLTYTAGTNGSLTGTLSQTVNHGASGTAVTAIPATNYHFVQWSDGSTANPRTDSNVTGNISVTAQFAINTYTLTYTAGTNGSLTGTLSQTVNHGASGTSVTAVPETNYHFVQWSDGSTANPRTDSNVTGNISVTAQFAINTYTLTYTAGANGSLTGTLSQTVNHGASGTSVTAVPATNYHFVQWSDGSTANPRTDSNVTGNISLTAQFAINTYTLTYTAGANGSLTGTLSQTVNHGASGTAVTAVPATNYHFVQWSDGSTANPRTDSNVTGNISVTAQFAINTYTLTYTAGTNGSLTGTLSQTVNHGASGTAITAVPATNYHFVQWSDGSTTNPRTDSNVTDNISVTAQFAINTYTLTYTAGANGSLTGTLSQTVNHGASGTAVTAVPATNYHFVQWSDGSTANPRTDENVTANISVTAQFALTASSYTLTYQAGANGSLSGDLIQTVNHGATGTAVTAVPATNYHFVQWSDGSTTNPRTDSNVTGNISVTAQFAINTYTLTYTAGANGSLTGTLSQTVNHGASGTAITAVPATNYHFVQWSDGSTANPRTDSNVTGNISVTAQFAINTYTLTYTAGANGSLTGTLSQTVNHGASGTAVTAVPATNYHFVQWSDGSTANPRTDSNVTGNISVTAQFAIYTYTLTYTAGANGSLTGTLSQTVNHGASGTEVTAVPATNYHFVQWSDGSTANPRTDENVTANISVTAQFALTASSYTLTYQAGANGSLSGDLIQTVNHGATGTAVTAVPATNYHFVQWSDGSTTNPRTDSNVTDNISVTAQFAINTYTLTYTAGANGSLTGTLSQTVNHGASGTEVTAVPATNYHFVQWSDGSSANPRTDENVMGDITVTAEFAITEIPVYNLTLSADPTEGGTLTGAGDYEEGSAITILATENEGYSFIAWIDNELNIISEHAEYTFNMPANDLTLTAYFDIIESTELVDKGNFNLYPNPSKNYVEMTSSVRITEIRVIDINGKTMEYIYDLWSFHHKLSISDYHPGLYFIHIKTENGIIIKKLQVVR